MSLFLLIAIPLAGAGLALVMTSNRHRGALLPAVSSLHLAVAAWALQRPFMPSHARWLGLDPVGKVVLLTVSVLFFCCSLYAPSYLKRHNGRSNRVFSACLLMLLAAMSLVAAAQHLGLMWVAIEATTLASAPLIHFRQTAEAIEATWKYLLLSSIGIALALLGSFFLAYASTVGGHSSNLMFTDLVLSARYLSKPWLRAAFVTLLVGYGTKMGLAPMHTWKPDAYGEAPGLIGALLAGGLTSCAFLAVSRFTTVMGAAGEGATASRLLLGLGLFSMATAAVFLVRQKDFKRMLAYSSVEHMGVLALGMGIGGLGAFGALLHLMNNALTKGLLFLAAANIHRAYGSKSIDEVRGAFGRAPVSAALFMTGFFAIVGSPPFGPFVSLYTILQGAFEAHRYVAGALFLVLLWAVFVGMGHTVLRVVQGASGEETAAPRRESFALVAPVGLLACLVLVLGVWLPPPLAGLLHEAASYLEVHP